MIDRITTATSASRHLPLASLALALLTCACGGSSDKSDDETNTSRQGDGEDGGGAKPTQTPVPTAGPSLGPTARPTTGPAPAPTSAPLEEGWTAFEFSYAGIPEPVKAKVSRGGAIEIQGWPKRMEPKLVLPRARHYAQVDDAFCADVESNAKAGRFEAVRGRGSLPANIEVMPIVSIDFANMARRTALDALGGVGAPYLIDAPTLTLVAPKVILADGAISSHLGTPETLQAIFTRPFVSLSLGTWNGEIAAMDLLCDLRAGKAKIIFEAQTDEPVYRPVSAVSALGGPT